MILLTKRNHDKLLVNHRQIEHIECIPETKITMMNHDYYLVRESVEEIKAIYEDITQKALRYQMEQKVLQEYAEFLMGQNCVQQGIDVAEKLRQHYTQDEKMLTKYKAELLLWLADLYSDHEVREYKKARHCISEVLEIIPLLYKDRKSVV